MEVGELEFDDGPQPLDSRRAVVFPKQDQVNGRVRISSRSAWEMASR